MKNKKKPSLQGISKNLQKYEKNQPVSINKKSPLKNKAHQQKSQTQTSLESSNFNFHPFKQQPIFYGKKYHYSQMNPKKVADSNQSSTHCSINNRSGKQKSLQNTKKLKSKSLKSAKNQQFCHQEVLQEDQAEIRLNERQVMQLINSYATKIQRQWRRYWFRKCLRFIILRERERKQFQLLNQYYGRSGQEVRSNKQPYSKERMFENFQQPHNPLAQLRIPHPKLQQQQKRPTLPKLTNSRKKIPNQASSSQSPSQSSISQIHQQGNNNSPRVIIPQKQQLSSNQNQLTDEFFNNKKYGTLQSFNSVSKNKILSGVDVSVKVDKQSHDRTSSLGEKVEQNNFFRQREGGEDCRVKKVTVEVGLNCSLMDKSKEELFFSTPINQLRKTTQNTDKKSSEKKSNIKLDTKVYECKVVQEHQKAPIQSVISSNKIPNHTTNSNFTSYFKNLTDDFKTAPKPSSPSHNAIKSSESISSKYDTKFPSSQNLQKDPFGVTKIFKKYKKAIQKQGNKKISKLEKNFEERQITQRTYKSLLKETKEKLTSQMKTLELKQGHFNNSWKEVYVMFKDYVRENSFHQQPQQNLQSGRQSQPQNTEQNAEDHQVSFDKWDFQSSAKKSISHLQSFQDFARQLNERNPDKLKGFFIETKKFSTDNKTIERVLDELDRLEGEIASSNNNREISEFRDEDELMFGQEIRQRERTKSFQKKSEHVLVENIGEKLSWAEIRSPNDYQGLSPKQSSSDYKKQPRLQSPQTELQKQQENLSNQAKYTSPKRQTFEFPQITTPVKSNLSLSSKLLIETCSPLETVNPVENIKTEQSEQDSEIEIKITSINIDRKENTQKKENELFVPDQNSLEKLSNSILKQLETRKELEKIEENIKLKEKTLQSRRLIISLSNQYFTKRIIPRRSPIILELSRLLRQVFTERKRRKQLQQAQLRKYPSTIDPTIDAINSWLLQISHHLLDHHNLQIKKNLVFIKQPSTQQMLQVCHSELLSHTFFHTHSYITISQKIFKEFEFFYLKNMASNLEIGQRHEQNFQTLLYAFHRCLIDCMNLTLLDQLIIGKNWVRLPWINSFRHRKNEVDEHTKQCLQRSINRVSGWGQYCLAQLGQNNQVNMGEWKQYQQEKMNLVIREEVLEYDFNNQFVLSNLVMKICKEVFEEEIVEAVKDVRKVCERKGVER